MGELIDIGIATDWDRSYEEPFDHVQIPKTLIAEHDARDYYGDRGGYEIAGEYKQDIVLGMNPTKALAKAIRKAQQIQ